MTEKPELYFGQRLTRGGRWGRAAVTNGPAVLWLGFFLLLPLAAIVVISFLTRGEYGGVQLPFTLDSYRRLAGFGELGFDLLYPVVLARSLLQHDMDASPLFPRFEIPLTLPDPPRCQAPP